jgi:flagellar basal-body rod modification protein FlgD
MEFSATMSATDQLKTQQTVDTFNKSLAVNGRTASQQLGKDDFLKILITQLANQDPSSPMDNTQFVAQMAQFSSLEQMTNMSQNFEKFATMTRSSEAQGMLGKTVELNLGDTTTTGVVDAATRGDKPQIKVNGMYYDMDRISAVYNAN